MPRRETYRTDDEDDDRRRAHASGGGGVPAWVWVGGGGGVLAVLVVVGLGFMLFTARRAEVRADFARAELMRVEADHRAHAHAPDLAMKPAPPDHGPFDLENGDDADVALTPLARIAKAYRTDAAAADERYKGARLRVEVTLDRFGPGWVGATAVLDADRPARGAPPNVIFEDYSGTVRVGVPVVIEATCDGLSPDPNTGRPRLRFTDARVVGR